MIDGFAAATGNSPHPVTKHRQLPYYSATRYQGAMTMMISMQGAPARTGAQATQTGNAEIREQIKQSILAAQDAAREAARDGALQDAAVHAPRGARTIRFGGQNQPVLGGPDLPMPPGIVYGTSTGGRGGSGSEFPPQIVDISIAFFIMCAVMVIGWPLARAFGKRLERRSDMPAVTAGTSEQLNRIEQAVEAMAIEVERISESQRFIAKLQNAQAPNRELKSS